MSGHTHRWGRVVFIAGLAVRHCELDCRAIQAQDGPHNQGGWVTIK